MPVAVAKAPLPSGNWLKGCDFSYSKPDLQKLWDAGYRVILGYLSDTPGKGLDAAYIAQALAIGFRIVPLYETTARAALGGRAAGVAQATAAMGIAAALGMPAGVTVIFALDSDYTTAEMATVSAFVDGLHAVAGSDGEYGGVDQLKYLIAHKTADLGRMFMTYAWQHGAAWLPAAQAPIEQIQNGVNVAGGVIDVCRVDVDNPALTLWEAEMPVTDADAGVIAAHKTYDGETWIGATQDGRTFAKAARDQAIANAATLAGIVKTEAAIQATLLTIAAAVASGAPVDTAALAAQIKAIGDQESTAVSKLSAQIADLTVRLQKSVAAEAAALNGSAS